MANTNRFPAVSAEIIDSTGDPITWVSSGLPVSATDRTLEATGSFTRPDNTTAYGIGDCVNNSTSAPADIDIAGMADEVGGGFIIQNAILTISVQSAVAAGAFRLHLFNAAVTPANDNAAYAPSDAEVLTEIGWVDFDEGYLRANNEEYQATNLALVGKCAAGSTTLYGLLEARSAYTPAAQAVFSLRLYGEKLG